MSGQTQVTSTRQATTNGAYSGVAGPWRLRALWSLYVLTVRQHLHGKRWIVMGVLFLLPAVLAILLRSVAPDVPTLGLEFMLGFMFIPQALLPLAALLYASGIIQDEQEEQTITYLLVRPIPKWAMYVTKLMATLTTTVVLTIVFTVLTYIAIYAGAPSRPQDVVTRCTKAAAIHSLAVVSYCSLFGFMSLLTNRILVVGIIYIAVVEGLLANLPFGIGLMTVIYYSRLIAFRTLEFVVPMPPNRTVNMAAEAWQFDLRRDPLLLEHPQINTCLAVLLIGSLVGTILAAAMCASREFHVKTPEKD